MKKPVFALACLLPVLLFAEPVRFHAPTPAGYSKYVEIDLGRSRMLMLSGVVALDEQGAVVGKGDLAAQTDFVFAQIDRTLRQAGASMSDLVKISSFMTDVSQVQAFRRARDQHVNRNRPPASTTLQVSRFVHPDVLIEVDAVAVVPK